MRGISSKHFIFSFLLNNNYHKGKDLVAMAAWLSEAEFEGRLSVLARIQAVWNVACSFVLCDSRLYIT